MVSQFSEVARIVPESEQARMSAALERLQDLDSEARQKVYSVRFVTGWRRAYVFQVNTRNGDQQRSYYLKLAVDMSGKQVEYLRSEASKTRRVYDAMGSDGKFQTVRPAAFYEDLACLILHECHGRRLDEIILKATRLSASAESYEKAVYYCEMAAQWLNQFQDSVTSIQGSGHATKEQFLARIERELITLNLSDSAKFTESICRGLRDRSRIYLDKFDRDDFRWTSRHNDFAPWNIVCSGDKICVLDYADLTDGSRCEDVSQFIDAMHVLSNRVWSDSSKTLQLKELFAKECSRFLHTSEAATEFFRLLYKLIRTGSVINNSRAGFVGKIRRNLLLKKYQRELIAELGDTTGGKKAVSVA